MAPPVVRPCPHCGNARTRGGPQSLVCVLRLAVDVHPHEPSRPDAYQIVCRACGYRGLPAPTMETALAQWNHGERWAP